MNQNKPRNSAASYAPAAKNSDSHYDNSPSWPT